MSCRLAVIVLTKNEERNLPDCLASLEGLAAEIWVVDSGSTDRTLAVARAAGCRLAEHPFETYAAQRNWAFDHLPIQAPWTLCLDADERLTPELKRRVREVTAGTDASYAGYMMSRRTVFLGRWLRHGGQYPAWHVRLFRTGKGRCEDRRYDQHFVVDGPVGRLEGDFIDVLTDSLTTWTERHNRWATLEAEELLLGRDERLQVRPRLLGTPLERKRFLRMRIYRHLPLFARPFLLFFFDYVLRLGFLDGVPGLIFHTLQRFWFRFLIDAKTYERRLASGTAGKRLLAAPPSSDAVEEPGSGEVDLATTPTSMEVDRRA